MTVSIIQYYQADWHIDIPPLPHAMMECLHFASFSTIVCAQTNLKFVQ
jgi:hypothetical protein